MEIRIRDLVKQLLDNEYLIVNYNENIDGGFDLSVRIDTQRLNEAKCGECSNEKED